LRVQQPREVPSDVAEPLDDHAAPFERDAEVARVFHHHVHDAATGGLLAPERAAERDGLPGHGRGRVAVTARVLVEDPGHDLRVGGDRKSTRLNSSHLVISYAVFCLKKKKLMNTLFAQT